jgi:hypothetical protein
MEVSQQTGSICNQKKGRKRRDQGSITILWPESLRPLRGDEWKLMQLLWKKVGLKREGRGGEKDEEERRTRRREGRGGEKDEDERRRRREGGEKEEERASKRENETKNYNENEIILLI